jgi:hypothetical protein
MFKLWSLKNTTPGAIAACAMLVRICIFHALFLADHDHTNEQARWGLSQDDFLQERGLETGIHWHEEFDSYLQYLLQGLQQKKTSVLNIFRVWDQTFFAGTDSSLGRHGQFSNNKQSTRDALDALNADEEDLGDGDGDA